MEEKHKSNYLWVGIAVVAIIILIIVLISNSPKPTGNVIVNDEVAKCTPNWKCSDWSECSVSNIQTRQCIDNNDCNINTNKPIESQVCTPLSKTWHPVTTLTSSTSKKTDTFNIKGEKWRFTWSCNKANDYDGMNIVVYKEGSNSYTEFLFMQKCPQTEETTFVYEGKGDYYFDINIANLDSWTIKVEDWY